MARPPSSNPTQVELQILQTFWRKGPATVREAHERLKGPGAGGYTSTLKMMQVMIEKGLLLRDDAPYPHLYRAAISEEQAQTSFIDDLVERVFGGAADKLVMRAVASSRVSRGELGKIRKLIQRLEQGDKS